MKNKTNTLCSTFQLFENYVRNLQVFSVAMSDIDLFTDIPIYAVVESTHYG